MILLKETELFHFVCLHNNSKPKPKFRWWNNIVLLFMNQIICEIKKKKKSYISSNLYVRLHEKDVVAMLLSITMRKCMYIDNNENFVIVMHPNAYNPTNIHGGFHSSITQPSCFYICLPQ